MRKIAQIVAFSEKLNFNSAAYGTKKLFILVSIALLARHTCKEMAFIHHEICSLACMNLFLTNIIAYHFNVYHNGVASNYF